MSEPSDNSFDEKLDNLFENSFDSRFDDESIGSFGGAGEDGSGAADEADAPDAGDEADEGDEGDAPGVADEADEGDAPDAADAPATADPAVAADVPFDIPIEKSAKRKRGLARRVLIVLCVILAVLIVAAGGAFAWWRHSVEQGKKAMTEQVAERASAEDGVIEYDGKRYRLNDSIVTLCFIGYDDTADEADAIKGGQSDTIMVIALDTLSGKARAISIPRDSMVTVDTYNGDSYGGQATEQICLQYSYGSSATRSSELVVNTVSRLLYNIPITYYFTLNIRGVADLNDAVGGVTITASRTVPESNVVEGQEITLMGEDARQYVQYRDYLGAVDSSLDRQERQKQYLQAFAARIIEIAKSDPAKLMDLYSEAGEYTCTNLGIEEYSYLVDTMLEHGFSGLETTSLSGEMQQGETFAEFYLDKDALRREVIDTFYIEAQ